MRSILNQGDRAEIGSRLQSLSASSNGLWGSMDVASMLQHLRLSARMTLGELSVPSANKRAFQVFPLKHLLLYVLSISERSADGARVETEGCVIV